MGETPHGILPDALFTPGATAAVADFLAHMWLDGATKAKLYRQWAVQVGVKLSASQVRAVLATGFDHGGPIT